MRVGVHRLRAVRSKRFTTRLCQWTQHLSSANALHLFTPPPRGTSCRRQRYCRMKCFGSPGGWRTDRNAFSHSPCYLIFRNGSQRRQLRLNITSSAEVFMERKSPELWREGAWSRWMKSNISGTERMKMKKRKRTFWHNLPPLTLYSEVESLQVQAAWCCLVQCKYETDILYTVLYNIVCLSLRVCLHLHRAVQSENVTIS